MRTKYILITTFLLTFIDYSLLAQIDSFSRVPIFERFSVNRVIDSTKINGVNYATRQFGNYILIENIKGSGVTDSLGEIIIAPNIDGGIYLRPNAFIIKHNNKYGLFDLQGNELLPNIYSKISLDKETEKYWIEYKDELTSNKDKMILKGLYSIGFGFNIEPSFYSLKKYEEDFYGGSIEPGRAAIFKLATSEKIDTNNIDFKYQSVGIKVCNLIKASYNSKQGLIDYEDNVIVPFKYYHIKPFSDSIFVAYKDNFHVGLINLKEDTILPFIYSKIYCTAWNDICIIFDKSDNAGLVSKNGDIVLKPCYEKITIKSKDNFMVKKNDKVGMVNGQGEIIVPFLFDNIYSLRNSLFEVAVKGKIFVINRAFECVKNCPEKAILDSIGFKKKGK
jgi:hypothetical protein